FDLARRDWSPRLLETFGVARELLPRVCESVEVTGAITPEAGKATGLVPGTPVVAGGGDAECGARGAGLAGDPASEGAMLSSIGTAGQAFAVTRAPVIDRLGRVHSLCHVAPGRRPLMGAILAGGVALRWLRDV